jgi:hypothetical protein
MKLLQNAGMVRNRLKVKAAVQNAKAPPGPEEFNEASTATWGFVNANPFRTGEIDETGSSDHAGVRSMSKDLRKRIQFLWRHHLLRLYASRRNGCGHIIGCSATTKSAENAAMDRALKMFGATASLSSTTIYNRPQQGHHRLRRD